MHSAPPRRFAVFHEDENQEQAVTPPVVGWGMQLEDRAIFAWYRPGVGSETAVGVFDSAERAVRLAERADPSARLVWIDLAESA